MPLKYPLSFKRPRTSTACFIFKAYPVTKDTSTPHLDYMWTGVSSWMEGNVSLSCPQASLCSTCTCFLIGSGGDQSHLSTCCQDTSGVVAKHRSTTFTSWTIFLKVRIWKIILPHRSAEAGPRNTCSFSVKYHHPAPEPVQFPALHRGDDLHLILINHLQEMIRKAEEHVLRSELIALDDESLVCYNLDYQWSGTHTQVYKHIRCLFV